MTNTEVGDLIGVSFSMVSRLRDGTRLPSPGVMENIGHVFGVNGDTLLAKHRAGGEVFGPWLESLIVAYAATHPVPDKGPRERGHPGAGRDSRC